MILLLLKIGLPFLAIGFISGVFIGRHEMKREMIMEARKLMTMMMMFDFLKEESNEQRIGQNDQSDESVEH